MLTEQEIISHLLNNEGEIIVHYDEYGQDIYLKANSVDDITDDPEGTLFTITGENENNISYVATVLINDNGKIDFIEILPC